MVSSITSSLKCCGMYRDKSTKSHRNKGSMQAKVLTAHGNGKLCFVKILAVGHLD